MTNIHIGRAMSDDERRSRLFAGDLMVTLPTPATLAFVEFTRSMVEQAFGARSPEVAQYDMPVEEYAAVLAALKPAFIHHPDSKLHLRAMLLEQGCDAEQTYFDVPRLRTSTSDDYLTTGIAYAFHAHRDTWYSAPMMQVNWWLPIYDVCEDNVIAFHPNYFDTRVDNGSANYNYYLWNRDSRGIAASQIGQDTRQQPKLLESIDNTQIRPVPPVGGITVFSGAQLHSSVPNTSGRTRISVDFRTVHRQDVEQHGGAVNVDSRSTGTTLRDYLRVSDLARLPDDLVAQYDADVSPDILQHAVYGG